MDALRWYHYIPGCNIIVDGFFEVPPTPEQLQDLLHTLGLFSIFFLSLIVGMPHSYTHEDYARAIARVGGDIADYDNQRGWDHYAHTMNKYALAISSACGVILLVLFLSASLVSTSFRGPDGHVSYAMLRNWWHARRESFRTVIFTAAALHSHGLYSHFRNFLHIIFGIPHRLHATQFFSLLASSYLHPSCVYTSFNTSLP